MAAQTWLPTSAGYPIDPARSLDLALLLHWGLPYSQKHGTFWGVALTLDDIIGDGLPKPNVLTLLNKVCFKSTFSINFNSIHFTRSTPSLLLATILSTKTWMG